MSTAYTYTTYDHNETYRARRIARKNCMRRRQMRQRKKIFVMSLTVLIMLACLLTLSGFSSVEKQTFEIKELHYEIVTVLQDNTVWDIATKYYSNPNETVTEYMGEIMKLNGLKTDRIYVGQKLAVPCYTI